MTQEKIINQVGESWAKAIGKEFSEPYMDEIRSKVKKKREVGIVYPPSELVFRAFRETPLDEVKVVWFAQDPYHDGSATGLAFECGKHYLTPSWEQVLWAYNQQFPTSFATDLMDGKLERWARQGVFLYNTALTVDKGVAESHGEIWTKFTSRVVETLIAHKNPKVFVMLGKKAQRYENWVRAPHFMVKREHPQFANYQSRKWDHGDIFTTINTMLKQSGVREIDW